MISKYHINIVSVKHLLYRELSAYEQNHCAAIICSSDFRQSVGCIPFQYYIQLKFQDTNDPKNGNPFSSAHAKKLTWFLSGLPVAITDLYIACDAGCSRSPAIAAALLRASHRSDMCIWKNPKFYPNQLVYKTACDTYHLFMPEILLHLLIRINRNAYRKAQRNNMY